MRYVSLILLSIALGINIFFRLGPAFLPGAKIEARNSVIGDLMENAQKQIDEKFKDLPPSVKSKVVQDLLTIWKKDRKEYINEAIKNKYKEIKSYWQDESKHTFLLEIDPYHWFRLVNNLVTEHNISDEATFTLTPTGTETDYTLHKNFHVYLSYYLFKLARIFNKNISLMPFLFYVPIFISSLALIAIFFFCSTISKDKVNISGFFAAMALGLSPIFLEKSLAGWFVTAPYVTLFPILSVWSLYCSLNEEASLKSRALFSLISGLCIGLFSFTWFGWWYIFDLIIFSALLYILNLCSLKKVIKGKIKLSIPAFSLLLFILSGAISVGVFSGWQVFKYCLSEPINMAFAKGYLQHQFWPNVFLTVSELRSANISGIFNDIGIGFLLFLSMAYWIIVLNNKSSKDYKSKQFLSFLFAPWVIIILYASLKAERFSLLLITPLSVSFGLFLKFLLDTLSNKINRLVKVPNIKAILLFISFSVFIPVFCIKSIPIRNTLPMMNRAWWDTLNKIKKEAPKDAVINSWWDYGHWFKAVSERKVIFDGATQNTPMAYWMARVLLTDNEKEAAGILRMLNSGPNKAFVELEKLNINKYKCLDILNEIILLTYKDANAALSKYIPGEEDRKMILRYTHNPQPAYFIVEPSLLYKIYSISFIGGWDFKKAAIYQKFRESQKVNFIEYIMKEYKYNRDDAYKLYDTLIFLNTKNAILWISSPYNPGFESADFRKEDGLLLFNNGFVVDINKHRVYFNDIRAGKWKIPKRMFYSEGGLLKEAGFKNYDLDFSTLLIEDKGKYKIVALDDKLANSMLIRLYYLGGLGLKSFKPFMTEELKYNEGRITVYKVEWDKN